MIFTKEDFFLAPIRFLFINRVQEQIFEHKTNNLNDKECVKEYVTKAYIVDEDPISQMKALGFAVGDRCTKILLHKILLNYYQFGQSSIVIRSTILDFVDENY